MDTNWKGVFPAVTTNFNADQSLDRSGTANGIRLQLEAGVSGVIVCGSLGEASTLTPAEKLEVVGIAREVCQARIPVLLTIAEDSTRVACALARDAARQGVDGLMVLHGLRYVSDGVETVAHFNALADASDLPMMIYNNPLAYGVDVGLPVLDELARNPLFIAIKESSGDIRRVTDIKREFGDRYQILCGVDNLALEALMMGADGWVAGLCCAFPRETVAIYEAYRAQRYDEALSIYRWFAPLLALDVSNKLVQNIKLAESMVGAGTEHVRQPRLPLSGTERANVAAVIDRALATRPVL
ncbi:dihydrodipicolinate synthase family protein [Thiomonas sp. FB-Cd]|uniref:dihydrodipicolinate synthase family protein n=1 Tax=Thiomonas sp. FB-Cd TaxID=1158292 RepID=UPI0004DEEF09|nr:dihydrodipicolinate synthase family protein [Thiomonas sp. FB-Cd]